MGWACKRHQYVDLESFRSTSSRKVQIAPAQPETRFLQGIDGKLLSMEEMQARLPELSLSAVPRRSAEACKDISGLKFPMLLAEYLGGLMDLTGATARHTRKTTRKPSEGCVLVKQVRLS